MVSFRFRALQSGRIDGVRIYLVHRSGGYMGGTGGRVLVRVMPDNGGGLPASRVLASRLITDPTAVDFPFVRFAKPPVVKRGQRVHIVLTNPDPDPVENFVSVNTLYVDLPQMQPLLLNDPQESVVLVKNSANRSWEARVPRLPIFEVVYTNGRRQGQGYVDARSMSGVTTIGGASRACEAFQSGRDRVVTSIGFRVRNGGSSTPLRVEVRDPSGVQASALIDSSRLGSTYAWASAPLGFVVRAGVPYHVVLSSDAGPYTIFPYQKGTLYGFANPRPGWRTAPDGTLDFPVYFSARLGSYGRAGSPSSRQSEADTASAECP
jgi:hypothetical protein